MSGLDHSENHTSLICFHSSSGSVSAWAPIPLPSSLQILYFIGLFPNLQDLKLCYPHPDG